jgi:GTP-binding protein Era
MTDAPDTPAEHELRCGMIAIVGRTNVGKSTLLNRLLEEKVSIVTPVAQTTRNVVRGIWTDRRGQLVFLDTPGMHRAEGDLGRLMNRSARAAIEGCDLVLLVVDGSRRPLDEDEGWMRRLLKQEVPTLVVVNKCDLRSEGQTVYEALWRELATERGSSHTASWLSGSALTGEGLADLMADLFARMPVGPLLFPEDVLTDFPRKLAMGDVVREKLLGYLEQELPHQIAVCIDKTEETDGKLAVSGLIYVNRNSQKGIVLGKKGRLLKKVTAEAERELSELYEQPVTLRLWVKVERNWMKNFWILRKLGYC